MKIQKVNESKIVRFFKDRCSANEKVKFFAGDYTNPQKQAEWKTRIEFYKDIHTKASFLRANLLRASGRERPQPIEIDIDYLLLIGFKQKWICNLAGTPLEFTRGGQWWQRKWCNPNSCTIDRIDSNKGYIPNNIQLLTWKINSLKQDFPHLEFVEICRIIAERFPK